MDEIKDLVVRNMTREEYSLAIEWAAQEGWNPGIHDAECFYAADPNGFFLAEMNGKPVGCLSAVAYDDHFGFAGFYIVKPGLRSRGIGHQLIQKASNYMGNRTIGNDAVITQQETYKKYGFRLVYRNIRYRGIASPVVTTYPEIIDLNKIPFEQLSAYDRGMFPSDRSAFLNCWIKQPGGVALGNVKDGQLSGYGVIRKCRQGYKIGPLFADSIQIAENLFLALTTNVSGEEYLLDIPEQNPGAVALVKSHNMQMVFETARMYSGSVPFLPLEKIFGVTSFELG
jgi:hypothetical protein